MLDERSLARPGRAAMTLAPVLPALAPPLRRLVPPAGTAWFAFRTWVALAGAR